MAPSTPTTPASVRFTRHMPHFRNLIVIIPPTPAIDIQASPQLVQNRELGAQLDGVDGNLVVALQEEEAGIAEADEAAVEADDEHVDVDEVVQQRAPGVRVGGHGRGFLQVALRFADVEE